MSLKPSKPEPFGGRRDALTVNTWLFQTEVYLNLVQLGNPTLQLDDGNRISFASTLLKDNAANWWYLKVHNNEIPGTWEEFCNAVRAEFVPQDSMRRSRDRLRRLVQRASVSSYLNEFRNLVLNIPNMTEDEKLDKFCAGLKPEIRLEVLKSGPVTVDNAARIALNVDSALFGAGIFMQRSSFSPSSGNDPMEIGNVEGGDNHNGRRRGNGRSGKVLSQRDKDLQNNACFRCHKVGCRPWKHGKAGANHVNAGQPTNSDSEN